MMGTLYRPVHAAPVSPRALGVVFDGKIRPRCQGLRLYAGHDQFAIGLVCPPRHVPPRPVKVPVIVQRSELQRAAALVIVATV